MQRIYRLTRRASFSYIFRKGERVSGKYLVVYAVKAGNVKVGVSVSKKVGNSVVRSRVKRRLSEAFRLLIPDIIGMHNFVVVALPLAADADYHQMDGDLRHVLTRMKMLSVKKDPTTETKGDK